MQITALPSSVFISDRINALVRKWGRNRTDGWPDRVTINSDIAMVLSPATLMGSHVTIRSGNVLRHWC